MELALQLAGFSWTGASIGIRDENVIEELAIGCVSCHASYATVCGRLDERSLCQAMMLLVGMLVLRVLLQRRHVRIYICIPPLFLLALIFLLICRITMDLLLLISSPFVVHSWPCGS